MPGLYPAIEAFDSFLLQVDEIHEIYVEQAGNPQGKPVIFLHGGPGGGCNADHRRYFNPGKYRVVLFDQRGCGRSKPFADLRNNTTWDLVADIEKIRNRLQIDRWQVFGGSWGSTLALAYSQKYPQRITELVLRGIFLLRRSELDWFYQKGASEIFPDRWEKFIALIPEDERSDIRAAYHRRLTSNDAAERSTAAIAWSTWEAAACTLRPKPQMVAEMSDAHFAEAFARIESHYFANGGFLESDDQLLRDVYKIQHIPATIVQGRYDMVCPMRSAWELHKAWPESQLVIIDDAGHTASEPGVQEALVRATDEFAL